jgi:hypothetical protein
MTAHRDDSACTGAVVRKPPMKDTAGGGAKQRVRRMGFSALVICCPRALSSSLGSGRRGGELSWPIATGSTGVAQQRLIDEAVVQGGATASMVMAGREPAKCSTGMSRRTYSDHEVSILITAVDAAGR